MMTTILKKFFSKYLTTVDAFSIQKSVFISLKIDFHISATETIGKCSELFTYKPLI